MFKLAMGRLPDDGDLCSQPTISRLENLPDARALLRMGRAMVEHYCHSFRQVPCRIVLDIDDTFDAVHGGQQLRLFNAHHDEYGFQPIVVFDAEGRMNAAVLRPSSRPSGKQIVRWLHRLITAIRSHWPRVEIMLRADRHYCTPEVLRFCRVRGLDYTLGVAPTSTLRKLRWSPLVGQFGDRVKLGSGCRQAASLSAVLIPYASSGVCPPRVEWGRRVL